MAETESSPETPIPAEVLSKLCTADCKKMVKRYRTHNESLVRAVTVLEDRKYESLQLIDDLEKQIQQYKENELEMDTQTKYHQWKNNCWRLR